MPALLSVIIQLLNLYIFLIIIWVVLGWLQAFNVIPYSRGLHMVMNVLYRLTDPVLSRIRAILPPISGIDLSPLVVIILIEILKALLRDLLL